MPDAEPTFHIRSIPVYGDRILSPMDGFSDLPFRAMCRALGSAVSYTEFINALDILHRPEYVAKKIQFEPFERPVIFQIFDSDPERLLKAALYLQDFEPDVIDINMGCSVSNVSGRGAGAGLLRTPLKIARIFRKLSAALTVPVTGKIRLGWDDNCRNYVLVARIIEECGGSLVAVHGRTKAQSYGGEANWEAIAEVRQAVKIPVIGNGDVRTPADIERMKQFTGCTAVMIGRAAIGNPWIFAGLERGQVPQERVRSTMVAHLGRSLEFYGAERGLVLFRKHAARYLAPLGMPEELRKRLLTAEQAAHFLAILEEVLAFNAERISG